MCLVRDRSGLLIEMKHVLPTSVALSGRFCLLPNPGLKPWANLLCPFGADVVKRGLTAASPNAERQTLNLLLTHSPRINNQPYQSPITFHKSPLTSHRCLPQTDSASTTTRFVNGVFR